MTNVTSSSVTLDTGGAVPYDYLVLAPGSTYLEPAIKGFAGTLAERKAAVQVTFSDEVPSCAIERSALPMQKG